MQNQLEVESLLRFVIFEFPSKCNKISPNKPLSFQVVPNLTCLIRLFFERCNEELSISFHFWCIIFLEQRRGFNEKCIASFLSSNKAETLSCFNLHFDRLKSGSLCLLSVISLYIFAISMFHSKSTLEFYIEYKRIGLCCTSKNKQLTYVFSLSLSQNACTIRLSCSTSVFLIKPLDNPADNNGSIFHVRKRTKSFPCV